MARPRGGTKGEGGGKGVIPQDPAQREAIKPLKEDIKPEAKAPPSAAPSERARLAEASDRGVPWKKWGPYLSERQWGTVREDYSESGDAWGYFTHDQARSRAYRWGEDGIAGLSDDQQVLCFALALWNGADGILKERLFGLANGEANHGEDVKEYYFYLDSTPTHSSMRYLYKYPQRAFPYDDLVRTNRERGRHEMEYELLDTGVFADSRYFDVFVDFAKNTPEDILIAVTVGNRGPEAATLQVLPHLWFRNTWSWTEGVAKPSLAATALDGVPVIAARHPELTERFLYCEGAEALLFTENESNCQRLSGKANGGAYVKDGINDCVVDGKADAVNPDQTGTKAAARYSLTLGAGETKTIRLRLSDNAPANATAFGEGGPFGATFGATLAARQAEANEFFASITPPAMSADAANVLRQALAGMLWSKQFYYYDVEKWLREHGIDPQSGQARPHRNRQWFHMLNRHVISMPDKWEYPWYAAWDLAFHAVPLAMVDPDFAKDQLELMLGEDYLHPNGQIPAYEWNFSDVNPPVHAWAALQVYQIDKHANGERGDVRFLEYVFQKLQLNFTWWVNRKDAEGNNVFSGGFLGLDNIGVFDRSSPLPTGGSLEQADGTAWMAFFASQMLRIATELAMHNPTYEALAGKYFEHFMWIASAMDRIGVRDDELWDEDDDFFYDVLHYPGGESVRLKVRSLVGLLPVAAISLFEPEMLDKLPALRERARTFLARHPETTANILPPTQRGHGDRAALAVVNERKLRSILKRMLDENEFLGPYGIRSLSHHHKDHPFTFSVGRECYRVDYEPAESTTGMFGGNSNWRGPVWMPINFLLVRGLLANYQYYGNDVLVECPTGSGRHMNLFEVAREIAHRLAMIFLRDHTDERAVFGGSQLWQKDPHWRDHILFYEYFHGDNGAGIGASHQTGWTGLIASLLQFFACADAEGYLAHGSAQVEQYLIASTGRGRHG